jgi:hypothetical protein
MNTTDGLPTPEEFDKLPNKEKVSALFKIFKVVSLLEDIVKQPPYDKEKKEVGDKVCLIEPFAANYLWNSDGVNISVDREEGKIMAKEEILVIKINLDLDLKCNHCPEKHHIDTLVYFTERKKEYYTIQKLLKLCD